MLDLLELEQFVAFARYGTLSKAAEMLHISQPTITRTMQKVERDFGVSLFHREANKIQLNETGQKAVYYANALLDSAKNAVSQVQTFDKSLHTITIESCAPAPLWSLLPILSSEYPELTISSCIKKISEIQYNITNDMCDIGVVNENTAIENILCLPFLTEALSVCVPPDNELAKYKSLSFSDMNGYNFLLRTEIGFWDSLCREKMPSSKFLVQTDDFSFKELIRSSSLPCFTTNLANDTDHLLKNRVTIPIADPEATVTYHLLLSEKLKNLRQLINRNL
ncbi:MAG: LysR family transcriptional regulator [Lachnospiraceae bacterium]|nr:LysR family transcriptional regulator [Lachnospiraceae bacterium]